MRGCKKCSLPPLFPREIASRGDRCNFEQIASWLLRYGRVFEQIHVHVCNVAHYAVAVTRDGLYLTYVLCIHSFIAHGWRRGGRGGGRDPRTHKIRRSNWKEGSCIQVET